VMLRSSSVVCTTGTGIVVSLMARDYALNSGCAMLANSPVHLMTT
jgi:hypothetical protein